MSRRERLREARLAEARVLYLRARSQARIARLRARLRHHRGAWLLGSGFGAGLVVARVPVRGLLRAGAGVLRIIGMLRLPIGALVVASGLLHESNATPTDEGDA